MGQTESRNIPLVSVIVPLYNHEMYIEECLRSVLETGYPRLELAVIDDGSTDASFDRAKRWLAKYSSSFVRAICRTRPNRGVAATLNELVAATTGIYVVPLASDDRLLPNGIERRVDALETRPDALACFGDARLINQDGLVVGSSAIRNFFRGNPSRLRSKRRILPELVFRWSIPGPSSMVRRRAYDSGMVGPYDETVKFEDREFFLRLVCRGPLIFLPAAVADYRINHASASQGPGDRRARERAVWEATQRARTLLPWASRTVLGWGLRGHRLKDRGGAPLRWRLWKGLYAFGGRLVRLLSWTGIR